MLVVSFVLVVWVALHGTIPVDSAEIKNKPVCLQRWEECMIEPTEPRRTAVECDTLMTKKYGCKKPKPWYRGRTGDYDYVLTRETKDTDKELEVRRGRLSKTDEGKLRGGRRDSNDQGRHGDIEMDGKSRSLSGEPKQAQGDNEGGDVSDTNPSNREQSRRKGSRRRLGGHKRKNHKRFEEENDDTDADIFDQFDDLL